MCGGGRVNAEFRAMQRAAHDARPCFQVERPPSLAAVPLLRLRPGTDADEAGDEDGGCKRGSDK